MHLHEEHPMREGESFSEWWNRLWHEDKLPASAYGQKTVIARMRRGKWVFIPPQWRGKKVDDSTKRKRRKPKRELALNERRAPIVEEFDGVFH